MKKLIPFLSAGLLCIGCGDNTPPPSFVASIKETTKTDINKVTDEQDAEIRAAEEKLLQDMFGGFQTSSSSQSPEKQLQNKEIKQEQEPVIPDDKEWPHDSISPPQKKIENKKIEKNKDISDSIMTPGVYPIRNKASIIKKTQAPIQDKNSEEIEGKDEENNEEIEEKKEEDEIIDYTQHKYYLPPYSLKALSLSVIKSPIFDPETGLLQYTQTGFFTLGGQLMLSHANNQNIIFMHEDGYKFSVGIGPDYNYFVDSQTKTIEYFDPQEKKRAEILADDFFQYLKSVNIALHSDFSQKKKVLIASGFIDERKIEGGTYLFQSQKDPEGSQSQYKEDGEYVLKNESFIAQTSKNKHLASREVLKKSQGRLFIRENFQMPWRDVESGEVQDFGDVAESEEAVLEEETAFSQNGRTFNFQALSDTSYWEDNSQNMYQKDTQGNMTQVVQMHTQTQDNNFTPYYCDANNNIYDYTSGKSLVMTINAYRTKITQIINVSASCDFEKNMSVVCLGEKEDKCIQDTLPESIQIKDEKVVYDKEIDYYIVENGKKKGTRTLQRTWDEQKQKHQRSSY